MEQLIVSGQQAEALPHRDYTLALLRHAAAAGSIPAETLEALRKGLHEAAAERAAAYTKGKSGTVTRKQAEAFYASVFCQLDVILLELHSDAAAEDALRSQPLSVLLDAGQLRSLQLYEEAKAHFRQAYLKMKPYQTTFFRGLLKDFEQFCTKYDARFRAVDTKVQFTYPLLAERPVTESGVLGVHRYYTALLREAELLEYYDKAEVQDLMQRYAQNYLTDPEMIAENIAELALRHRLTAALAGGTDAAFAVTAAETAQLEAAYENSTAAQLCADLTAVLEHEPYAENAALLDYLKESMPALSEIMFTRIEKKTLKGWFALLPDEK
ncbi:MAG TPA: hypothetical protein DCG49_12760 [Ruminococcus sp.]|nr:hypothetical protein [Ruminococcus sp.]